MNITYVEGQSYLKCILNLFLIDRYIGKVLDILIYSYQENKLKCVGET